MSFVDVIARKRDGQALSADAIDSFVDGATRGTVPDYQLSALLMAIVWRGMSAKETALLTDAMVRSGARMDLSDGAREAMRSWDRQNSIHKHGVHKHSLEGCGVTPALIHQKFRRYVDRFGHCF